MTAVLLAALALAAADPQTQDTPPASPAANPPANQPAQPPAKPAPKPPAGSTTVKGVTVDGAARAQVETSIDRRSYSVANDLQAKTGSLSDVLRNIPSVQVDVQGNLSLRGDPNVTILVDGKPSSQFNAATQAQALQALPADQIDRIEVITNPSAEFRADGSGGIINLITKKAKGAGKTASLRIQGGTGNRGIVSGTVGYNSNKLSLTGDATYQHAEVIQTFTDQSGTPSTGVDQLIGRAPIYQSVALGHVGADYDLSAKTRLSGSLRFNYVDGVAPIVETSTQDNASGTLVSSSEHLSTQYVRGYNGQASVILRHKYAEGNDLTLDAVYDGNQQSTDLVDSFFPTQPPGLDTATETYRANFNHRSMFTADYERPLPGKAVLKMGYDVEYNANFVEHHGATGVPGSPLSPAPALTDNFIDNETHNQAYITYQQPFGKLDVLFGLRGETVHLGLDQVQNPPVANTPDQTYSRFYPTLHLAYDLGGGKQLTASYSKRVVRPQPIDLDPFRSSQVPTVIIAGNPSLLPQDTDSYELGFENRKAASSFLATLYYRQTNNAFSTVFTDLGNNVLLQERENAGYQANGGLELVSINKLTSKLTYNLSADGYWTEVSAPNLVGLIQGPTTQSAFTGFGRANLNWQMTPKDFVQFNIFANGKALLPQGYTSPMVSGNVGYRHTINNKVSWSFVLSDPFKTLKSKIVLNEGGLTDKRTVQNSTRFATLTLVWNFSGKPTPTNFDFTPGGGAGAVAP